MNVATKKAYYIRKCYQTHRVVFLDNADCIRLGSSCGPMRDALKNLPHLGI